MAHQGHPTTNGKNDATSSTGGFARFRVSLGLIAIVVLATAIFMGATLASGGASNSYAAALADAAAPASSSTSMGPTTIGSAWSMAPVSEAPTFVASATDLPPLTRASSVSYSPR